MKEKIRNSLWMISEKIIAVLGLIFVTSFVAKYVGPTIFGIMSVSMLVFQFIQSISVMGSDVILLKRISRNKDSGIKLMLSTFFLVLVSYFFLSVTGMVVMKENMTSDAAVFIFAAAIACLFSAIDLVNVYNEATLNAKLNVIANVTGLVISLLCRYIISYLEMDPRYLSIPIVLVTAIPFLIKTSWFMFRHEKRSILKTRHVKKYSKYMISSGGTLIFSIIAVSLYTRFNQISVSYFLGVKEAGIFSVALTLSTAWTFVPYALLASFYPSFFAEKDPGKTIIKIQNLHLMVLGVSGIIILSIHLLAGKFIEYFYGIAYLNAVKPTLYLSIAAMFAIFSSIMDRFIIKYNGYKFLVKKTFFVLIICFISSVTLVPFFGIDGAALSVIITEFFSFSVLNYFFRDQPVIDIHKVFINPKKIWDLFYNIKHSRK
ncbi:flippase [Erwinia psidii]|uniref:oligosaccharide flippase family protein n=1 Tax=Erwinia psidii TaxID=69224 RepID=UPI00226B915D|nr:oligosaccharide flippase family protein [Erwinia psidii]MCX8963200.1 flippase [Erwinia psidii]